MVAFRVIDADSHVEEPLEAWSYLDPKYEARRPFPRPEQADRRVQRARDQDRHRECTLRLH